MIVIKRCSAQMMSYKSYFGLIFILFSAFPVSTAFADEKNICQEQYGVNAYVSLVPKESNPTGVYDGPKGAKQLYGRDAPFPTAFRCIRPVGIKERLKSEKSACANGLKLDQTIPGVFHCVSEDFPIKALCPSGLDRFTRPGLVECICGTGDKKKIPQKLCDAATKQ
jgi:hypothetical protein